MSGSISLNLVLWARGLYAPFRLTNVCLQPAPPTRSKEKFVSLPEELDNDIEAQLSIPMRPPSIFEVCAAAS